jgi:nucleotide-binding universal stress UspA family protein
MFHRVLVPVDIADAEPARPAVATARYLADSAEAEIRLVYVIPFMVDAALEYLPKDFFEGEALDARRRLRSMAMEAGLPEGRTTFVTHCGAINQLVLKEAETLGADLIIIGSHRPSMSSYFLGSSASAILRSAMCSVLVRRGAASQLR